MSDSIPIRFVYANQLNAEYGTQAPWLEACRFAATAGSYCLLPGEYGVSSVLVGRPDTFDTWTLGSLSTSLPPQRYHLADRFTAAEATKLCLGWKLGQYRFTKYKQSNSQPGSINQSNNRDNSNTFPIQPELVYPDNVDQDYIDAATEGIYLVRDLVNTPPNDMGPAELEACAQTLASTYGATLRVVRGEELKSQNYPMIYAVGQASDRPPRLLDLHWGNPSHPKITLVGKGVCFDSGGLNLKSSAGMKLMKKDMGGSAQVLGLALMIMKLNLPIRLRVLVGAVENSVSGNANRPSDILPSRKGLTVEIGNTDAEGRLVLADMLWDACEEDPSLIVNFATLTGAARVALGTELPAFFCNHSKTASDLQASGELTNDELWQLPLYKPYRSMIDSKVADLSNIGSAPQGGAITAALFLQEFVKPNIPWVHIDLNAWNVRSRPGRPEGGEAMGIRALFHLIQQRIR
ncbi:MAG: leucyl aminopeptidase family protein [Cyanobacteria bacterium P01_F01_bin.150]